MDRITIGLGEPEGPRAPTPLDVGCTERHHWTAEQAALLGTRSDVEVAALVGLSIQTVFKERLRRGIPSVRPSESIAARSRPHAQVPHHQPSRSVP